MKVLLEDMVQERSFKLGDLFATDKKEPVYYLLIKLDDRYVLQNLEGSSVWSEYSTRLELSLKLGKMVEVGRLIHYPRSEYQLALTEVS